MSVDSITPALLTIEEAAAYLNTTVRHLRRLKAEERIPYTLVGKFLRFRRSELDEWIDENTFFPV